MDPEITAAVANHFSQKSWLQEIVDNAETISIIVGAIAIPFWRMMAKIDIQKDRILKLETLREQESRSNEEAHGRLEKMHGDVMDELKSFRVESASQHDTLTKRQNAMVERVGALAADVARLTGRSEVARHEGAD